MPIGVDTRLDGSTVVVRIPMRFQGRWLQRIVAPDANAIVATHRWSASWRAGRGPDLAQLMQLFTVEWERQRVQLC